MSEQISKAYGAVDIVFLLNAADGMQPCIDALKANIGTFIYFLTTKGPTNVTPTIVKHWRAKAVGYLDIAVDKDWFIDNPFVEDIGQLKAQLAALLAHGGGDDSESLLEALYRVVTMEQEPKGSQASQPFRWRERDAAVRVVIVFTDASYQPVMEEPKGGTVTDVIKMIHANRVRLLLYAPEMPCYDELMVADKSEYWVIPLNGRTAQDRLREFTANQTSFRKVLEDLARSVSSSFPRFPWLK